jgi:hypothetical protein
LGFRLRKRPRERRTSDAIDLDAVRQAQQRTWSEGDFAMVANLIAIVAEELAESLDLRATGA